MRRRKRDLPWWPVVLLALSALRTTAARRVRMGMHYSVRCTNNELVCTNFTAMPASVRPRPTPFWAFFLLNLNFNDSVFVMMLHSKQLHCQEPRFLISCSVGCKLDVMMKTKARLNSSLVISLAVCLDAPFCFGHRLPNGRKENCPNRACRFGVEKGKSDMHEKRKGNACRQGRKEQLETLYLRRWGMVCREPIRETAIQTIDSFGVQV